jgi:competence protein ComEC
MIRWLPYVFVRIVFFFIAGIWAGIYFPALLPERVSQLFLFLLIALYCIGALIKRPKNAFEDRTTIRFTIGLLGLASIFLAGYLQLLSHIDRNKPDHIFHITQPIDYYKVVLTGQIKENESTWKMQGDILATNSNEAWHLREGKVLLYFPKRSFDHPFHYGDRLVIKGSPNVLPEPANPEEFNYKRFLSFKNVYHQQFLNEGCVQYIGNAPPNVAIDYASKCRAWAENVLDRYVTGEREQGIISALVLGVTDGLDNELLSAYSATGAMHVLAVSGLHVGVIYWLLLLLLKPLNKRTSGKWIIAFVSVVVLWSYAFITGLSPSVLRAVTMFSFVALARPRGQHTNIYNTLAASAFILLLYDPYLIMSVGFQLSYLAVLGIVYIHPHLFSLFEPDGKIIRWIWEITSISIAAQLATFSLGLLYFHQFPNYFIFSNLVVIPVSTGILIAGLALLVFSFVPIIASLIGIAILWAIKLMNYLVFFFESLPFSIIENVYINTTQCWLLIGIIVSFVLLFKYRKFSYIIPAACLTVVFSFFQWQRFFENVNQRKFSVYNVRGHSAIDLMDKGHAYFLTDSSLYADKEKIRFHIMPHRLISGINNVDDGISTLTGFQGCDLIRWNGISILQIRQRDFSFPLTLPIDYLIISNNAVYDFSLLSKFNVKEIILDSSNSSYFSNRLLRQANGMNIVVHSVLHEGAYIAKL